MHIPEKTANYRQRFHAQETSENYRGWAHFGLTIIVCTTAMVVALWRLENVTPLEWLTIPIAFLYGVAVEYIGHRGPMHHKFPLLGIVFERHAQQHHRFFTHEAMAFESSRDFKAVLFPPVMLVFFFGCFALPMGLILFWLFSANVAWLFVFTAVAYFFNYELFHFAYHVQPDTKLGRNRVIMWLKQLHQNHHNPALMQTHNFNITYPLGDWVMGTLYRQSTGSTSNPSASESRQENQAT